MDASLDPHLLPFVSIITLLGCMLFRKHGFTTTATTQACDRTNSWMPSRSARGGPSSRMVQVSPWIHRTLLIGLFAATSAVPVLAAIPVTLLGARPQAGCAPEEVISRWTCSRKTEVGPLVVMCLP